MVGSQIIIINQISSKVSSITHTQFYIGIAVVVFVIGLLLYNTFKADSF